MKLYGEAIQVTDMQRAEIVVEGVVQKGVIDCEVDGWGSYDDRGGTLLSS